jgi:hypothetical protein
MLCQIVEKMGKLLPKGCTRPYRRPQPTVAFEVEEVPLRAAGPSSISLTNKHGFLPSLSHLWHHPSSLLELSGARSLKSTTSLDDVVSLPLQQKPWEHRHERRWWKRQPNWEGPIEVRQRGSGGRVAEVLHGDYVARRCMTLGHSDF